MNSIKRDRQFITRITCTLQKSFVMTIIRQLRIKRPFRIVLPQWLNPDEVQLSVLKSHQQYIRIRDRTRPALVIQISNRYSPDKEVGWIRKVAINPKREITSRVQLIRELSIQGHNRTFKNLTLRNNKYRLELPDEILMRSKNYKETYKVASRMCNRSLLGPNKLNLQGRDLTVTKNATRLQFRKVLLNHRD
jgi:hypothetical protein